jgi:tetratricopeptide (TPR) repeat protein
VTDRVDERIRQARLRYERAVLAGDEGALAAADRDLDGVEADLALARGRLLHARFLLRRDAGPDQAVADQAMPDPAELGLFERARQLYRALGDERAEAEALFWVGCCHQVVLGDDAAAVPALELSLELASRAGDQGTMAEALRHLGIHAHREGRLAEARQRLADSTRLRRETGQWAGVAANLVGLAYIAIAEGRHADALAILDEAGALAGEHRAVRIAAQVREARQAATDHR